MSYWHIGSHHHHHQPLLIPPSPSSLPISQTYVHKYSYNLPGSGSYFKMHRVYTRPFLPSSVGREQFRSSYTSSPEPHHEPSELGRLKDNALLSSLSFLPEDFGGDAGDLSQNQTDNNNSSVYHNPRYDPFNPRYAVSDNNLHKSEYLIWPSTLTMTD